MSSRRVQPTEQTTDVVGARIAAQIVDIALQVILLIAVVVLFDTLFPPASRPGADSLVLVSMLSLPLYGGVLEATWNGQTVGKRVAGIAVVDRNGETPRAVQTFLRNLPAVVLFSWLTTVVALASIATSDRNQRVFDDVADTYVVRE